MGFKNVFKKVGSIATIPLTLVQKGAEKTMQAAIAGIVRHLITTLAGGLIASGALTDGQLQEGTGAILVLVGIVWSIVSKKKS